MYAMFAHAESFNQPLTFDTSQVTNMRYMFRGATAFNQPLTFDTEQVTDMEDMFEGATAMTYPKPGQRPKPTTKQELRTWIRGVLPWREEPRRTQHVGRHAGDGHVGAVHACSTV